MPAITYVLVNRQKFQIPVMYHDIAANDKPSCGADVRGSWWVRIPLNLESDELCICTRCMRLRIEADAPNTDDYRCVVCQRYGSSRFCDECADLHPVRFTLYVDSIFAVEAI